MVDVAVRPHGPGRPFYGEAKKAAGAFFAHRLDPREVRRVSSSETGQTFMAVLDGQPRVGRESDLEEIIEQLELSDVWLAARASYPEGGPKDGQVECLLFFGDDGADVVVFERTSNWLCGDNDDVRDDDPFGEVVGW